MTQRKSKRSIEHFGPSHGSLLFWHHSSESGTFVVVYSGKNPSVYQLSSICVALFVDLTVRPFASNDKVPLVQQTFNRVFVCRMRCSESFDIRVPKMSPIAQHFHFHAIISYRTVPKIDAKLARCPRTQHVRKYHLLLETALRLSLCVSL